MLIKSSNIGGIDKVTKLLINVRKINIFNRRGLKISKGTLLKKKGKKASS